VAVVTPIRRFIAAGSKVDAPSLKVVIDNGVTRSSVVSESLDGSPQAVRFITYTYLLLYFGYCYQISIYEPQEKLLQITTRTSVCQSSIQILQFFDGNFQF
jgi:hypothetical protein